LIPLSHQHQHALALCVRIDRAAPVPQDDLGKWQDEVAASFRNEIEVHFLAEEAVLFPAARRFKDFAPLIEELLEEHAELRRNFAAAEAKQMSRESLSAFAKRLSTHIRREEAQLFEGLQKRMTHQELARLGSDLKEALRNATQACSIRAAANPSGGKKKG
jgi:hemerythrin-like domain-containing protein